MHKVSRWTLLTLCSGILASAVAATAAAAPTALAADEARGEEIKLLRLDAKGAVVLLRSIAGVKEVEIVDDKTLRVQGTPDRVHLARKILELTEATGGTADAEGRYDVGDGTIVACAALRESSRNELMTALRELGIGKIAVVNEPPAILVRDSEAQVTAALELIRAKVPAAP